MSSLLNCIQSLLIVLSALITPSLAVSYSGTLEGCFTGLSGFTLAGENNLGGYTLLSCSQACDSSPVIALSGNRCYCGNAIPPSAVSTDSSSCKKTCPYYEGDMCGDPSVYLVYLLQGNYASTAATSDYASLLSTVGSSSQSTQTSTDSSSTLSSSDSSSSTGSSSTSGSTDSSSSTSSSSTPSSTPSSTSSSSGSSTGSSSTATSTSSSSTSSAESSSTSSSSATPAAVQRDSKNGISGGAIAGIVVGVVVGVLALAAAVILFVFWKRKHREPDVYSPSDSPSNFKSDLGSFRDPYPPQPPRQLMDPRLNPAMLGDPRISIASLADARDYSRQILTVTNPDEKT